MSATTSPNPNQEVKTWFQKNRLWIFIVLAFILSNAGTYFYQKYRQGKLREDCAMAVDERAALAAEITQHHNERLAETVLKPLAWGVRGEMMRGNKELVDHFLSTTVQETDINLVVIVDMTGMVYLSTDKKYENRPVVEVLPTMPKGVMKPGVFSSNTHEVMAAAPIFGDTQQLGVLFFIARTSAKGKQLFDKVSQNPFIEVKE